MAEETLTLHIPEPLFQRLKERADEMHRSVEEEALLALATSMPKKDALPHDWQELLDSMSALDDAALWQAAQNDVGRKANTGILRLRAKRRTRGLTVAEQERLAELLRQEEKGMLIRSQALLLLKQRGSDIEPLLHLHEQASVSSSLS